MTTRLKWMVAAGAVVAGCALLAGPVATWLQGNEFRPPAGFVPDAVYLVAGARAQDARVAALTHYVRDVSGDAAGSGVTILVGPDQTPGPWCREEQRNLSAAEWATRKIRAEGSDRNGEIQPIIVPGEAWGTDQEMALLGAFLAELPYLRHVVLVTSPFHVRRTVAAMKRNCAGRIGIHAIAGESGWRDHAPWTVLGELLKFVRDGMKLSRAPFISREFYAKASVAEWLIVGGLVILVYGWLLYPILLGMVARMRTERPPGSTGVADRPGRAKVRVAVLVAAHNEERVIAERIRNLTELDRSGFQLQVVIGVDGSTDRTAELARRAVEGRDWIQVYEFPNRRGKTAVLKDLVEACPDASLLVFTDANSLFRLDAVTRMVRHFDDLKTGGVCGRLVLKDNSDGRGDGREGKAEAPEAIYWDWESRLKQLESRVDSCLGGNGAIYSVRRDLFWRDIPDDTIVDDLVIGMKVREQGFRVIFDPDVVAVEEPPAVQQEWRRRVRIGAGDYQALSLCWRCLLPSLGWFSWMFWSHKVIRWFTPHLLLLLPGAGVPLLFRLDIGAFAAGASMILLAAMSLLAVTTARGLRLTGRRPVGSLLAVEHFLAMQAALFVGFLRFCRGDLKGHWERTERTGDEMFTTDGHR